MAGLGKSLNTYEGPVPPGVPNPYTVMLHSYPTRYHGPIYTRPMFNLDWATRPNDFALREGMMGLGEEPIWATAGLGDTAAESLPPAWRVAVAAGLTVAAVWAAMKLSDAMAR
jgi:hypothetical protein